MTHPWAVIEAPQGHGSHQSFTRNNNNQGDLTALAKIYSQDSEDRKAFIKQNLYSADKLCWFYSGQAAPVFAYRSVQDSESATVSVCISRCTRCDGAVLRGLCLRLRRGILRERGKLDFSLCLDSVLADQRSRMSPTCSVTTHIQHRVPAE